MTQVMLIHRPVVSTGQFGMRMSLYASCPPNLGVLLKPEVICAIVFGVAAACQQARPETFLGSSEAVINAGPAAVVLKNDFRMASWRALDWQGSNAVVRNVQIIKNILNRGNSYHLKANYLESGAFFLHENVYTNNASLTEPVLDPHSSPFMSCIKER